MNTPKLGSEFSTLVELMLCRAAEQAEQTAYTFLAEDGQPSEQLTYAELDIRARAIAASLQETTSAGDRVLLVYPPGLDFICGFFGCLYAGVIAVPVFPPRANQSLSAIGAIVKDTETKEVMTTDFLRENLTTRFADVAELKNLNWKSTDNLSADNLSADKSSADKSLIAQAATWNSPPIDADSLAFLQYTSGSTGTPKGVMVSHRNLIYNSSEIYAGFGHGANSHAIIWLPFYHDMGLIGGVLQPMYGGFQGTMMAPVTFLQQPIRWLKAICDRDGTTSGGPNFAFELCVQKITSEQCNGLDLSRWDVAFSGAEPVRAETIERFSAKFEPYGFRREAFYPCYGMAESTLFITGGIKRASPVIGRFNTKAIEENRVESATQAADSRFLVGCGRVWCDHDVVIVNPETAERCQPNEIGEIWSAGTSKTQGYWNRPEETSHAFDARLQDSNAGPFLRTGDLGFIKDRELFITGRLKDLVIIRGRNHYPQDIEKTLDTCHPALRAGCGAAFSVDSEDDEQLVVVQEIERSHLRSLNVDETLDAIRGALAEHHELQPYAIVLLKTASIPKTTSGKIKRRECRQRFLDGSLTTVAEWRREPSVSTHQTDSATTTKLDLLQLLESTPDKQRASVLENAVRAELARVLNIAPDKIQSRNRLFDLGLDSLQAMELKSRLESGLSRELRSTLLFDYPILEDLVAFLLDDIFSASEAPTPASKSDNSTTAEQSCDLEQLTDEEAEDLLSQELEKLNV